MTPASRRIARTRPPCLPSTNVRAPSRSDSLSAQPLSLIAQTNVSTFGPACLTCSTTTISAPPSFISLITCMTRSGRAADSGSGCTTALTAGCGTVVGEVPRHESADPLLDRRVRAKLDVPDQILDVGVRRVDVALLHGEQLLLGLLAHGRFVRL